MLLIISKEFLKYIRAISPVKIVNYSIIPCLTLELTCQKAPPFWLGAVICQPDIYSVFTFFISLNIFKMAS
jgi:hypothetical protein